jgi:CheY-like chemotaxis protein
MRDDTVTTATTSSAAASEAASLRPLQGVRVLLAENEHHTREALAFVLEHAGAEVRAVDSARAALAVLAACTPASRPHVLVSDIGMPDEDGNALIRAIRAAEADSGARVMPAAALTAYARAEDRGASLAAGFQLHIAKPVEPDVLVAAVLSLARVARASP